MNLCIHRFFFLSSLLFAVTTFSNDWVHIGGPRGLAPTWVSQDESGRIFTGSYYHGIFYSDNGGDSWSHSEVDTIEEYMRVEDVVSDGYGTHIASTIRGIYLSENSGGSWLAVHPAYWDGRYHRLDVMEDGTLFCWSGNEILRSTNNGWDWEQVWATNIMDEVCRSFTLSHSQEVYRADGTGHVFKSSDRGETWNIFELPQTDDDLLFFLDLAFSNEDSLLVLYTFPRRLLHTVRMSDLKTKLVNGGRWEDIYLGLSPEGDILHSAGSSIHLYDLTTQISTPLDTSGRFGQYFPEHSNAIWIGESDILLSVNQYELYRSQDGGLSWEALRDGFPYRIPLALQINRGRIIVSCHQSFFTATSAYTDDMGTSWEYTNMKGKVASISSLGGETLIAGGVGGVYRSQDNGDTWDKQPTIRNAYSLFVADNHSIFVGYDYNGVYRSNNGGISWSEANNGYTNSYSFGFGQLGNGRIYSSGWPSGTYYTDNYGDQWQMLDVSLFSSSRSFSFCGTGEVVNAGLSQGIAHSKNGGVDWTIVHYTAGSVSDMRMLDTGECFALATEDGVLISLDTGRTWQTFNERLKSLYPYDLAVDSSNVLYLATGNGIYVNDTYTRRNIEPTKPNEFHLSYPYPNPFNSSLHLQYSLPITSNIQFRIFNVKGQVVWVERQTYLVAGDYMFRWAGINNLGQSVSAGVYLIQLSTDSWSESRKVVVLR